MEKHLVRNSGHKFQTMYNPNLVYEINLFIMDKLPILTDDYHDKAVIEPTYIVDILVSKYNLSSEDIPKKCVLSFKYTGLEKIIRTRHKVIRKIDDIGGDTTLYIIKVGDMKYCYSNLCIGGPCSALVLETIYGLGVDEAVYIGSVGSLREEIRPYDIIICYRAIRDEGTSYHYLPPSTYVEADKDLYIKVRDRLRKAGYRIHEGTLWTTDAAFRETWIRRELFMNMGALAVDMEAASLYALARYRGRKIMGIYFPVDLLGEDGWRSYIDIYGGLKYLRFIYGLFKVAIDALK